jgi:clan AA aspartic protease
MGTFRTTITVSNPDGDESEEVMALVDTGAVHTMLPADLMQRLNIEPVTTRRLTFANGESQMLPVGLARIGINGERWPCPVIFSTQDEFLLGATTLEIFDLVVDPVEEVLTRRDYLARPL